MHYEITIGEKHCCSNASFGGCVVDDPMFKASDILSGLIFMFGLKFGLPVDKDGNPAPSGTVFKDTNDTDEYTWIPFPYLSGDLRAKATTAGKRV